MLKVSNLYFEYPNKRALEDVSFTIEKSSITALVGPNGAGKTTLMRCIAGLETPFSGSIFLDDINVLENPKLAHAKIGYLSDFFGVYKDLTVKQCLSFAASIRGIHNSDINNKVTQTLEMLDLQDKATEKTSNLSRGMRQRLGIAQAIIHSPKLLILDEPASGLDPEARVNLSTLIKKLQTHDMTIIVSSHILSELEDYCTEMVVIRDAKIIGGNKINASENITAEVINIEFVDATNISTLKALENYKTINAKGNFISVEFTGNENGKAALLKQLIDEGLQVTSFKAETKKLQDHYMQLAKERK